MADSSALKSSDAMQFRMLGVLCLAYGSVTFLGVLIPNPWNGRLSFLFIGGAVTAIGLLLYRNYRRMLHHEK